MGTKKGQVRKTARRAYEPKKNTDFFKMLMKKPSQRKLPLLAKPKRGRK